jgi:signal transduction histidine kinase
MAILRESMAPLQPASPQSITVARCIRQALDRASLSTEIRVVIKGIQNLPNVLAGEKQLEMVFYNLIDNACKAMRGSGELEIVGFQTEGMVAVSVKDSGPGIPAPQQAGIFEFAAAGTEKQEGSLSFGLWWVKTFVERFGGRVELESKVGQGSKFIVWLSVAENS